MTLPDALVASVHERTEGNPFFVGELGRLLEREGWEGEKGWAIRVPEGIRGAIGRRLDRLPDLCNDILTTASVIGREFDFRLLARLNDGVAEDELLDVIDEALGARVIEQVERSRERYQFSHALIQQTLFDELSASRRIRRHARIAEVMEEFYGAEAEAHAGELVDHFAEAETVLGTERLIHYATVAGQQALEAVAPSSAEDYFQTGVDAFGNQPPDARLAEMLGGLGRAQVSTLERDQLQRAVDNLKRSFDLHLELGQPDAAVRVATTPMTSVHGGPSGMADLLERALPLAEEGSQEQGRLLAEFGLWVSHERADYAAAVDAFEMGPQTSGLRLMS